MRTNLLCLRRSYTHTYGRVLHFCTVLKHVPVHAWSIFLPRVRVRSRLDLRPRRITPRVRCGHGKRQTTQTSTTPRFTHTASAPKLPNPDQSLQAFSPLEYRNGAKELGKQRLTLPTAPSVKGRHAGSSGRRWELQVIPNRQGTASIIHTLIAECRPT